LSLELIEQYSENLRALGIKFSFGVVGSGSSLYLASALESRARYAFQIMKNNPVGKDKYAARMVTMKQLFSKSVAPLRDIKNGTVLQEDMLTLKKPGTGIDPSKIQSILGRRLKRNVTKKRLIKWSDLE
tara:strand:+ start:158 stop:544 length:387 start_codon:yes stop_codon:yes gene_type:complete